MNKQQMIDYLKGHFRYSTMNNWNHGTSYAANVKVHTFVPSELRSNAYELLQVEETYDNIHTIMENFARAHNWEWQAAFNGRSSGYIVLYQGRRIPSNFKSRCSECGQKNFTTTEETGKRCGICGGESRVNFKTPDMRIETSGKGTDEHEDFTEWNIDSLRSRVKLVKEFDRMVEDCKAEFLNLCKTGTVEEETIMIPKKIKVLKIG